MNKDWGGWGGKVKVDWRRMIGVTSDLRKQRISQKLIDELLLRSDWTSGRALTEIYCFNWGLWQGRKWH